MHCPSCPMLIESEIADLKEVEKVKASLKENTVEVEGNFGDKNKEEIALETGYKASTLNNAIQLLKDTEVLLPVARGYYKVNPFLFGSGSWRDIIAVRAVVDWNRDGKTIKTILESKDEK